jgi:hypothetical protein
MARLTVTELANGRKAISWTIQGTDENDVTCTECGKDFWKQPADFLRYDRYRDAWVTKAGEDGAVLPQHGICKPCQDKANAMHDEDRYGGPNHWQVEQRLMEDERWVWAS